MNSTAWLLDDKPLPDPHGKGEATVKFIKALRHPKSSSPRSAFQLDRWQERIVRRVYGDTDEHGRRRIKTVFLMVPRGARKTTFGAALCMVHTCGPERVPGGQVLSCAVDRDQARIAFDEMRGMISVHPRLTEALRVQDTKSRITHKKTLAQYRAMSADGATAHGRTPGFALMDEIHAWKKRDLWDAIQTGLTKTAGSLQVITTTAGIGRENLAWEQYQYAKKVAAGEIVDPSFLPILFEPNEDDDWRDEALWHRVNPGLALGYPDIDGLRKIAREAEHKPADAAMFKQLHLGFWLDGAAEPAWNLAVWDECAEGVDLEALRGSRAWIGVDLSKRTDLTAVTAAIELPDGRLAIHALAFSPAEGIRRRAQSDGAPYVTWRDQEWLTECEGDIVDLDAVEAAIRDLCERFEVQEVAFDRWSARTIMDALDSDGLPVVEFPQNIATFARPVSDFEAMMLKRRLVHDGNPVLRWCLSNIVLWEDASGNRRPDKKRAPDRIDLAVSTIMAVGRAVASSSAYSIYTNEEARPEGLLVF